MDLSKITSQPSLLETHHYTPGFRHCNQDFQRIRKFFPDFSEATHRCLQRVPAPILTVSGLPSPWRESVETTGIEPATSGLQSRRSPD